MTRALLLLLALPAHADLPTNFWSQVIRERASRATNPPPREPTDDEKLLAKLRMARLVRTRREGTTIFYSLDNDHIGSTAAQDFVIDDARDARSERV